MWYRGREFTLAEIDWIKEQISSDPKLTRSKLSRLFCQKFKWIAANGGLKEVGCRVAFLRMERDGYIHLPPQKRPSARAPKRIMRTLLTAPRPMTSCSAGSLKLELEVVTKQSSRLWNEYIDRYHYLGYKKIGGAQLRYFILGDDEVVALSGFGSAAWKTASRDNYIGWSHQQRQDNLHLVVNNVRFLILPWASVANLGSRILSLLGKRIPHDWQQVYNYRPVLLETFVQKDRFHGTVYKASNWTYVGDTTGRGKRNRTNKQEKPIKSVWLFPLTKSFLFILTFFHCFIFVSCIFIMKLTAFVLIRSGIVALCIIGWENVFPFFAAHAKY